MKPRASRHDKDKDLADLNIYDDPSEELRLKGIYYITGEIDEDSLLTIHQDMLLKHLNPKWKQELQLIINSVGGLCSEAWALIDLMQYIRLPIRTIGMGECASMGAMLLAAGTPGKRYASHNLSIMIHESWTDFVNGNKTQIIAQMKSIQQEHARHINFWVKHSNLKTQKNIEKQLLNGLDKYLTPKDALKIGIVDHVQDLETKETIEE